MESYNIKFNMPYIEADTLKQKHYSILLSLIGNSRLQEFMKFDGPGLITFAEDDTKHWNPIVTRMEKYNRLKTNCLIYTLPENPNNMGYYDKLFIYWTAGSKISYYGYVMYNTNTGKNEHIYFIDDNYNDLTRCLNQSFNALFNKELFAYYAKKYDAVKGRRGLTLQDCPSIKDYENVCNEMKNRVYEFAKRKIQKKLDEGIEES